MAGKSSVASKHLVCNAVLIPVFCSRTDKLSFATFNSHVLALCLCLAVLLIHVLHALSGLSRSRRHLLRGYLFLELRREHFCLNLVDTTFSERS